MVVAVAGLVVIAVVFGVLWAREHQRSERLEAELDQARRRASERDHAPDAFFDLATHELRSPLAAILGYQELLEDGAYGDLSAAHEPIDRIGRSARHLLHLIDGVIELSRLRTGSARPERGTVNLGVLFSTIAEAFRTHASERSIEPRVTLPAQLPTIQSDQDRLLRALDLLMTSALKHPAESHLALEVSTGNDGVLVRIHPADIEVREASEDPAIRLGIRLAVADALARLLGGSLDLQSESDGCIRTLTLRIRDLTHVPDPQL